LKIVSYYTDNYEPEAKKLIASLQKFNLDHNVVRVDNFGSWGANTHFKPKFILEQLQGNDSVVWTDADSIIKQNPVLFDTLDCDIAFHRFKGEELLSGTVYFKNNERVIKLLNTWIEVNSDNSKVWDQKNLDTAVSLNPELVVYNLPPEYCFIFDLSRLEYNNVTPVIEHFQASRKYKCKNR